MEGKSAVPTVEALAAMEQAIAKEKAENEFLQQRVASMEKMAALQSERDANRKVMRDQGLDYSGGVREDPNAPSAGAPYRAWSLGSLVSAVNNDGDPIAGFGPVLDMRERVKELRLERLANRRAQFQKGWQEDYEDHEEADGERCREPVGALAVAELRVKAERLRADRDKQRAKAKEWTDAHDPTLVESLLLDDSEAIPIGSGPDKAGAGAGPAFCPLPSADFFAVANDRMRMARLKADRLETREKLLKADRAFRDDLLRLAAGPKDAGLKEDALKLAPLEDEGGDDPLNVLASMRERRKRLEDQRRRNRRVLRHKLEEQGLDSAAVRRLQATDLYEEREGKFVDLDDLEHVSVASGFGRSEGQSNRVGALLGELCKRANAGDKESRPSARLRLGATGAVEAAVGAMRRYPDAARVQLWGARLLGFLSSEQPNRDRLEPLGGVTLLQAAGYFQANPKHRAFFSSLKITSGAKKQYNAVLGERRGHGRAWNGGEADDDAHGWSNR